METNTRRIISGEKNTLRLKPIRRCTIVQVSNFQYHEALPLELSLYRSATRMLNHTGSISNVLYVT